jgi:hypothetical protein
MVLLYLRNKKREYMKGDTSGPVEEVQLSEVSDINPLKTKCICFM